MLRGGSGRGSATQRQSEAQVTQPPQRSRYIFKDALIVAQTAPDEYTLYTIHSYNDRECVCIDIEDQSERRFPWEHIYLLNHQRSYVEGSEVLALSKEGTEWLTAYYPARVYPSSRYTSSDEVFSVLFDSDFAEFGDQAIRKELPERAKNLYGNDVPTVILKTSALPFVPEALAYQEHKSMLKAERKLQKRNVAATAAAATLYGGADASEPAAAMGLHPHGDGGVAAHHLTEGMSQHESAAARSLRSTSSLAEAYANGSTPNPIPYWRAHRPHLSVEQLEQIAMNVLSQVGKRVRLVPSLQEFMERKKQHQMHQEGLQMYQNQPLQEQQLQEQQMLILQQQQQQLQLLQEQQEHQKQEPQNGEHDEGASKEAQGTELNGNLNETGEVVTKPEDAVPSSTFVSGIGTTARWDAARSIVNQTASTVGVDEKTVTAPAETIPPLGVKEEVTAVTDATGEAKVQTEENDTGITKTEQRPEDTTEEQQPRSTTAPFVALF